MCVKKYQQKCKAWSLVLLVCKHCGVWLACVIITLDAGGKRETIITGVLQVMALSGGHILILISIDHVTNMESKCIKR